VSTWTTKTCVVVGIVLGLLLGLVGCDDTGPNSADAQRAWQRQIERTPLPAVVDDSGEEWPTVTGPYSVGAIR
jgi:hypothetical protein